MHPDILQLLFILKGGGVLSVDNAELALKPPVLVVVPCGCVHAFRFKPQIEGWVLSIADTLVDDDRMPSKDLSATMRGSEVLRLPVPDGFEQGALLATLLDELLRRHSVPSGLLSTSVIAIVGLVLALADEIARTGPANHGRPHDRRISLYRRFSSLVEKNMDIHWPVERYARELGTTASTLNRACREVSGMAPAELALDRRLRKAMRALSFTDARVSQISDDLGFSDPAYFARVFKQYTGTTASAYRKERLWSAQISK